MIPKIIHYCWFGRNPKPKLAEKCIKSWEKKCPDYEIIEWNEDNFDIAGAPLYVRQAYEAKKWAFVTDYVRLWAMTTYGGIYMDTDVEVIKSLDKFLIHRAFSGFESDTQIPTGIMACEKDFPLFLEFLHYYDEVSFIDEAGNNSTITNVLIITDICMTKGLRPNNTLQTIEGFTLYPRDVFCPFDYRYNVVKRTRRSATIHWFSGSWVSEETKRKRRKTVRRNRKDYIVHFPNMIMIRILGIKKYDKLKKIIKGK